MMSKQQLIERIYKDIKFRGIPKVAVEEMVQSCFSMIVNAAKDDIICKLSGFGTFYPTQYKQKKGHNPNTGEPLTIAAQKKLKFRASEKLLHTLEKSL